MKKTVKDVLVKDKVILLRTDYNVPMKNGHIVSDFRIKASLDTIKYLLANGAKKIIIISHLGRPEGKIEPSLSLAPVAKRLAELLPDNHIFFVNAVHGSEVESVLKNLPKQGIVLLENLRFYSGEESNSTDFVQQILSSISPDLFIQDGFAVCHRAHASTQKITEFLPSASGLLLEHEIENLSMVKNHPAHPLSVVIGGSKISDKQPLINQFLDSADHIYVGGKIAADGFTSPNAKITVASDFRTDADGLKLDIGEKSVQDLIGILEKSQTVIWNGTLGKTEDSDFAISSTKIATFLGTHSNIKSIICGGDTVSFAESLLSADRSSSSSLKFTLLSTGGGASLEFLLSHPLPGFASLQDKD